MTKNIVSDYFSVLNRQDVIPTEVSRKKTLSIWVALTLVAGTSLVTFDDAEAAETKKKAAKTKTYKINQVDLLQEENAKLRAQLERLQAVQANPGQAGAITTPGTELSTNTPEAVTAESPEAVAKAEANKTDNLGEVTVRGRAKPKIALLKETTVSASVVGGDELKSLQATDLSSILNRVGGIKWNSGNSRTAGLTLRGVGMVPTTDQMDSSVGTVVDGVPWSYGPMNSFDQYDVDTVEIDRGPTGTNGGRNFNAGQVKITNKQASFDREASGSVSYGSYNTVIGDAAIGGGVIDGLLAFRAAFHVNKADGFVNNLYNPQQTWYNRDRENFRLSFLLTPTQDFSAKVTIDAQPASSEMYNGNQFYTPTPAQYANGQVNKRLTDPYNILQRDWFSNKIPSYNYANNYLNGGGVNAFNLDTQQPLVSDTKGVSTVLDWKLGNYKLSSTTAARGYNFQAYNDGDGTPFNVTQLGGGSIHDFQYLSEELKLSSSFGKLVDYDTGVYLNQRKMYLGSAVGYGSDAGAWNANDAQYKSLNANGAGKQLMVDSLNGVITQNPNFIDNKTAAYFLEGKWHISDPLTLTTGVRVSAEDRANATNKLFVTEGAGSLLDPVSVNGVKLGGFASYSDSCTSDPLQVSPTLAKCKGTIPDHLLGQLKDPSNLPDVALADKLAKQYFGSTKTYDTLTDAQRAQVGNAKNIRAANVGALWNQTSGNTFQDILPQANISPSYKFNENITGYTSWKFGQKAGFSQTVNGVNSQIKPEINNAFEIGFKSNFLNNDLIFNSDFFANEITNYQQGVSILDTYKTNQNIQNGTTPPTAYVAAAGNAKGVEIFGVEIDGSYRVHEYSSIRFAGAYTDARYSDFKNSAVPLEWQYGKDLSGNPAPAYRDVSGQRLPGAAQFAFNVGPEVRFPARVLGLESLGNNEVHGNFNTNFNSGYNSDPLLSSYGWIKAFSTTDLSVGIGRKDKGFDISLVAKNVFDAQPQGAKLWNSYTLYQQPQWFGFTVSGKF